MYNVFKIYICSTKEHWWALTSSWPDEVQSMFSAAHRFFKLTFDTTDDFHKLISYMTDFSCLATMIYLLYVMLI